MKSYFFFLLPVFFSGCKSYSTKEPIDGPSQDTCLLSQYNAFQNQCINCPSNCDQCYLESQIIQCSTCAKGFFFDTKAQTCLNECGIGQRANLSQRLCQNCSVSLCSSCQDETELYFTCLKCIEGYTYDQDSKLCIHDCREFLFDVNNGQCVEKCNSNQMQIENKCITKLDCPNILTLQNDCFMSKIIKVIKHPTDSSLLIAVGRKNISIFVIPLFNILAQYKSSDMDIVDCSTLNFDTNNLCCFNSNGQIMKFDLFDLSFIIIQEVIQFEKKIKNEIEYLI